MAENGAKNSAGFFGDYNCDLPPWTFEMIVGEIRKAHSDIDYVILTGDSPARRIWNESKTSNLEQIHFVAQVMKKYFKSMTFYSIN